MARFLAFPGNLAAFASLVAFGRSLCIGALSRVLGAWSLSFTEFPSRSALAGWGPRVSETLPPPALSGVLLMPSVPARSLGVRHGGTRQPALHPHAAHQEPPEGAWPDWSVPSSPPIFRGRCFFEWLQYPSGRFNGAALEPTWGPWQGPSHPLMLSG